MKEKQHPVLSIIKQYAIITLGVVISAIGWTAFLIPSEIVGGGVTGLASVIYFGLDIPVGISILIANVVLILFGYRYLGKGFAIKTIYSFSMLSIFIGIGQAYITEPIVSDRFMAAIIGGILGGGSIGILFSQGGSTGGTEILAMLINRKRNISPGKLLLMMDVLIIASSYFVLGEIEAIVYGYVSMGVVSYVIDLVLTGNQRTAQLFIISKKSKEISDIIGNDLGKGVTLVKAQGWYTKQDFDMVMVVVRKSESTHVFRMIKEVDAEAFISMGSVMGVYGNGFDELKVKTRKKEIETKPSAHPKNG
ncbi:MAG: membrane protein [Bacteroidetes bacterium 4572_77]|nr:MAG: membrane protein [Bacteroidetes bacterium 4572_77]